MRHFLYFPFTDYADDGNFGGTRDHYEQKYGSAANNKHGEAGTGIFIQGGTLTGRVLKPLKVVGDDDVLLIMAHGSDTVTSQISMTRGKGTRATSVSMTHDDLADLLRDEGLKKTHKVIKMLSCYAGGSQTFDATAQSYQYAQPGGAMTDYFAKLLAQALGRRGYGQIVVGGYPFMLSTNGAFGANKVLIPVINDPTNQYQVGALGGIVEGTRGQISWWDASGNDTAKPALA